MTFDHLHELITEEIVEESLSKNFKALVGIAILLGIDVNYTFPKLKEMIHARLQEMPQEQIVELKQKLPDIMRSPMLQNKVNQVRNITASIRKSVNNIVPQTTPVPPAKSDSSFVDDAYNYIRSHEGVRNKMYKDIYGNLTIGIGHLVKPEEVAKFKGKTLTENEIEAIFKRDVKNKLILIHHHFGNKFESFPNKLKIAILDGYFRGDLSGSPVTRSMIMKGRFGDAAKEYLNNREYQQAKKDNSGVASRMEKNASIIANTKI